eukprot:3009742-Alexandrium_andersonii.AAC.1
MAFALASAVRRSAFKALSWCSRSRVACLSARSSARSITPLSRILASALVCGARAREPSWRRRCS